MKVVFMKKLLNLPNSCIWVGFKISKKIKRPARTGRPDSAHTGPRSRPRPRAAHVVADRPQAGSTTRSPSPGRRAVWPVVPGERGPLHGRLHPKWNAPRSISLTHSLGCALLALSRSRRGGSCSVHCHRDARRRRRVLPPPRPLKPRLRMLEHRHHLRHPSARFPPLSSSVKRPIWPVLLHRHGRDSASSRAAASPPPCSLSFSLHSRTGAARPRIEGSRAQS